MTQQTGPRYECVNIHCPWSVAHNHYLLTEHVFPDAQGLLHCRQCGSYVRAARVAADPTKGVVGAAGGAIVGWALGGPAGALVGGVLGLLAGAAVGAKDQQNQ